MKRFAATQTARSRVVLHPGARPRLPSIAAGVWSPTALNARSMFGIGEILGVVTNPGDMLRSLAESKKLLEETRQEMKDNAEREQIPPVHAFSPLPGFWDRPTEVQIIERALGGVPAFTVVFGASSVGKTALLRQVLSSDKYHVIHFDLRIAGFADLASLYFSLSRQMERYFASLPELLGTEWGWGEFEKESWAFKHDRFAIEKRVIAGGTVKTSDLARLMEMFQSSLLKYWDFVPMTAEDRKALEKEKEQGKDDKGKGKSKEKEADVNRNKPRPTSSAVDPTKSKMREGWGAPAVDLTEARTVQPTEEEGKLEQVEEVGEEGEEMEEKPQPPVKRIPVIYFDEAHKLPALIQSDDAMKSLLDSMLVLTKQDRLCHVLHATSDPFYMHWLRQLNIMQHCNILSVGDPSREEAKRYFSEHLTRHVPDHLSAMITFEGLYEVFGGKLAHLADYTAEFTNSNGAITPSHSSHFLQAHSLLNLQLIHSSPTPNGDGAGFEIYSPIKQASPHSAPSPTSDSDGSNSGADFSNQDLLYIMQQFTSLGGGQSTPSELLYFNVCRKLGARATDGMIRAKILELRWSNTVTEEGDFSALTRRTREEVGPVLVPTTPVMRYAMGRVLEEYKGEIIERS